MYIQENDFVRKMKTFSNSVALPFSSFGPLTNWREEIWRLEIMLESEPRVEQIACTVDFVPSQKMHHDFISTGREHDFLNLTEF